jgi:hypothetical protein
MEVALAYFRTLEEHVSNIQTQLNTKTCDFFPSEHEFLLWKSRAKSALLYKQEELCYLKGFIGVLKKQNVDGVSTKDAVLELENIMARVRDATVRFNDVFKPQFSAHNEPQTTAEARERWRYLSGLRGKIDDFLTEINRYSANVGVKSSTLTVVKRPLSTLNEEVRIELTYLNKFLQERGGNRMLFLLGLVERAVQNGLQLSSEELEILHDVRHHRQTLTGRNA